MVPIPTLTIHELGVNDHGSGQPDADPETVAPVPSSGLTVIRAASIGRDHGETEGLVQAQRQVLDLLGGPGNRRGREPGLEPEPCGALQR